MLQFTTQIQKQKIRNYIMPLLASVFILSSCGGNKTEGLADLKAKQAELKTQLSEINTKISKLEGDSNKKFVLIEASAITPTIFKTYINVQGRVDAEENVAISSEVPGTVTKIHVKVGDEVSKGQVLAETDSRAALQQLAIMQTSLALVTQMYEKQKNLWDQKIGTEVQFLQVKAMKEASEQSVAMINQQISMSKIVSPINGTVDGLNIKVGQAVAPGSNAISVINFSNLKVKADLAESYATKVHKGDEVIIKFPNTNDTLVEKIDYASRAISPLNRTFGVEILLSSTKEYHPNQIAVININDYKSVKPVISIALNYVQKDLKGQHYVLVAENNKATRHDVALGKEYNGKVEILSGLSDQDLLITSGYDGLNEGDAVKIKK